MPPQMPDNDHDLLIQLHTKVDTILDLADKVDSLAAVNGELKNVVGTILVRLNGHIPDKCITHEADVSRLQDDFVTYKTEHVQLHEAQKRDRSESWRTVLAVAAIIISVAIPIIGWFVR